MRDHECRYILTLAELKNISKASEELFLSQPYLSKFLNKLESDLGVKLFDRSRIPMELTYAGEVYIDYIKKMHNIEIQMKKDLEEIAHSKKGRIRIGIPLIRGSWLLPKIIPKFIKKYPNIEIAIHEDNSANLEKQILKNTIDFSIGTPPIYTSGVKYEVLIREKMLLVMPANHPLNIKDNQRNNMGTTIHPTPFDMKMLDGHNFILLHPNQGIRIISEEIFNDFSIKPKIVLETKNIETALRLAAAGVGSTFVTESIIDDLVSENPHVYYTIGDPPFVWTPVIAYKSDILLSSACTDFMNMCKNCLRGLPVV